MSELERIERLERRIRGMAAAFGVVVLAMAVTGLNAQTGTSDVLRVRQLVVTDSKGVDRVIIGAPLPDPVIDGRRVKRSGAVAGITVLDAKGNERGGFATADASGEVFIGLDSESQQETLFLINPKGGGHFSLFDGNRNFVRLGILDGKPTLIVREKGKTIFEQPPAR